MLVIKRNDLVFQDLIDSLGIRRVPVSIYFLLAEGPAVFSEERRSGRLSYHWFRWPPWVAVDC